MCDPPLNSSHEVWPSPFGAHFHWWPSPLRPQPSPPKKKRNFPKLQQFFVAQYTLVTWSQRNHLTRPIPWSSVRSTFTTDQKCKGASHLFIWKYVFENPGTVCFTDAARFTFRKYESKLTTQTMFISVRNLIIKPRKIKCPRWNQFNRLYSPSVVIFFFHETICFLFYVLTYFYFLTVRNCLALNQVQNALQCHGRR